MIAVLRRLIKVQAQDDQQGRHRPPRQPPHPLGRRAAAEPVPRRPAAPRARRARAHDRSGHRDGHAAGADQHPPRGRGDQRVLRLLAALAVHGPDQLARRADAQAPSVGARAGRSVARARGLRSPRRPPLALRPHLPDRDAGRPEHRSDRLARDVRARQPLRLHRDAVPRREGRHRHQRDPLLHGRPRRRVHRRAGQHARSTKPARSPRRRSSRATPRNTSRSRPRRCSSWTSRPSRSSRSRRR